MKRAQRVQEALQRAIRAQKAQASIRQCQAVNEAGQRCALVADHLELSETPHRTAAWEGGQEWT